MGLCEGQSLSEPAGHRCWPQVRKRSTVEGARSQKRCVDMASLRRRSQQAAGGEAGPPPAAEPTHDDQLDVDDMTSIAMFLLARRESGTTIDDPEDLFPAYSMTDVYGIHSGPSVRCAVQRSTSPPSRRCSAAASRD